MGEVQKAIFRNGPRIETLFYHCSEENMVVEMTSRQPGCIKHNMGSSRLFPGASDTSSIVYRLPGKRIKFYTGPIQ